MNYAREKKRSLPFVFACGLLLAPVAAAVPPAIADSLIKLKDGTVRRFDFDPQDIDSITYAPKGQARPSATNPQSAPDSSAPKRLSPADRAAIQARRNASPQSEPEAPPPDGKPDGSATPKAPEPAPAPGSALPDPGKPQAGVAKPGPHLVQTLRVGPGQSYDTIGRAAAAARDGDTIEIAAGDYTGAAAIAVWRANKLVIRGVNGRPHLKGGGESAEGKGIWVTKGANIVVENIEFSDAKVSENNAAGIRIEGANITIRNCDFHDNQNGVLASPNPQSDIVIENSIFTANGLDGEGYTHNIYIGAVRSFVLSASLSHRAIDGHNVKSRARLNRILYNRIMDEADGTASYAIDISEGGTAYIIGNVIQQGPKTSNNAIVALAAEKKDASDRFYVVNNTIVNDLDKGIFIDNFSPGAATVINNILAGPGTPLVGNGVLRDNLVTPHTKPTMLDRLTSDASPGTGALEGNLVASNPGFVDATYYDYHLLPGSPAIGVGIQPRDSAGTLLLPEKQYEGPAKSVPRPHLDRLDLGALAYVRDK